jgi:hypothetical protein
VELPNKADLVVAKLGRSVFRKRIQLQVREIYVTRGSPIKSANDVQQRTLSRARFTYDGEHFAFGHLKRQIFKEH